MKGVLVGFGIQGQKRHLQASSEIIAIVDPLNAAAEYKSVTDLEDLEYEFAILSSPDDTKIGLIKFFLEKNCHVLVEKPLIGDTTELKEIIEKFKNKKLVLYTA